MTGGGALFWELGGKGKGAPESRLSQGGSGLAAMWNAFGPEDEDKYEHSVSTAQD